MVILARSLACIDFSTFSATTNNGKSTVALDLAKQDYILLANNYCLTLNSLPLD